ncbi:hypothetical protein DM01DRAFT_52806 [Hesseltinella vesiculosa]|uniref:Galactose oxidase n=1 Tax=Hesseltinella vesiculosa TaxID=101127 RepID=A0A1X2GUS3_9FUNG|nr:hypothetical protein DM01DRAFT_52806 [Hesseltinella vesiculosa]
MDLWRVNNKVSMMQNDTLASNSVILYDIQNNKLSTISPPTPGGASRCGHTANLVNNHLIYILGGVIGLPSSGGPESGPQSGKSFQDAWVFDTTSSQWNTVILTGSNPTMRIYHTTTNVPNTNKLFVYGGGDPAVDQSNQTSNWVSDRAFLIDCDTNAIAPAQIQNDDGPALLGHSAIAYEQNGRSYIFIIWGVLSNNERQTNTFILDATNTSSMSWLSEANGQDPGTPPSTSSPSAGGLSNGAIAGVTVGAVVVGVCVGAFAIFYRFRKRKQRDEFKLEKTDPRRHTAEFASIGSFHAFNESKTAVHTNRTSAQSPQNSLDHRFSSSIPRADYLVKPFEDIE